MFPVEDEKLLERIMHVLKIQLEDNVKTHILQPDGTWEKPDKRGKTLINCQEQFCEEASLYVRAELGRLDPAGSRVFIPTESQG